MSGLGFLRIIDIHQFCCGNRASGMGEARPQLKRPSRCELNKSSFGGGTTVHRARDVRPRTASTGHGELSASPTDSRADVGGLGSRGARGGAETAEDCVNRSPRLKYSVQ